MFGSDSDYFSGGHTTTKTLLGSEARGFMGAILAAGSSLLGSCLRGR